MSELYRDFIEQKADQIINSLGGTITPAPANAELYRDFLDRKFDDAITALDGIITPAPPDEMYRDFLDRKFDDVINSIGSGNIDDFITGRITEIDSEVASIRAYCCYDCTLLTDVNLPNVSDILTNSFRNCRSLVNINIPNALYLRTSAFSDCVILHSLNLPKVNRIDASCFLRCALLSDITLGNSSVAELADINAFSSTPFASNGSGGTLRVPQDLIASYQSANNWSTILSYPNNQIITINKGD